MRRGKLRQCLAREMHNWTSLSGDALRERLRDACTYTRTIDAEEYQVEAQLLEDTAKYVHVGVSVSAGLLASFVPVSSSFVVFADGRVDAPSETELLSGQR